MKLRERVRNRHLSRSVHRQKQNKPRNIKFKLSHTRNRVLHTFFFFLHKIDYLQETNNGSIINV